MVRKTLVRLEDRNWLTLLKLGEVALLGRFASSYCYNHPSHVYLELTARCNLRCDWCIQIHDEFRQTFVEDMPFETFQQIVPKLTGTKVLYLSLNGEPLLYDRLCDAIAFARDFIPSVRLITNGVLLDRAIGKELKKAGLAQLGISIDSPDRELMYKIRGVSLEMIADNVREFTSETGIPLEVRTTICAENIDSLKSLPLFVSRLGTCRLLFFTLAEGMTEVGASGMSMLGNQEAFIDLKQVVLRRCRELGLRTNLEYMAFYPEGFFDRRRKGRCDALFGRHLAINSKGFILPCCRYWTHHLENIGEVSFEQGWNGRLTRDWRRRMLQKKYPVECSNWCGFPTF